MSQIIMSLRSKMLKAFLAHVEGNAPIMGGTVEVPLRTHKRLQKGFKKGYVVMGLSWNRYAPQFGFDPAK